MRLSGLKMTEEKDSLENKFNNSSGFSMLYSQGSVIVCSSTWRPGTSFKGSHSVTDQGVMELMTAWLASSFTRMSSTEKQQYIKEEKELAMGFLPVEPLYQCFPPLQKAIAVQAKAIFFFGLNYAICTSYNHYKPTC